jgi:hypothetical protein
VEDSSTYRLVLIAALALAGLLAFLLSRNPARDGLILFVVTLGLGYRTVRLTEMLWIHPCEVVLVAVLLIALARPLPAPPGRDPALPWWLWALVPFMALGWLPRGHNPYDWDAQLAECVNVVSIIPVFLAVRMVLADRRSWRPVIASFYAVGTAVAFMGGVEYVYPNVRNVLPGFVSNPEAYESADGFHRAAFSFYGNTIAVFLCTLALPLGLALWSWYRTALARLVTVAAGVVQLGGLYISGYRSQWAMVGLLILLVPLWHRRYLLAGALVAAAAVGTQFLPEETLGRLQSLERVVEGSPDDSSGIKRKERVLEAAEAVVENPLGNGWASAGWAHSDFLQVSANLGLFAGLTLLVGYLYTLVRLARQMRRVSPRDDLAPLGFSLFLSLLVVGQMLAVQGVEFLPFTVMPAWLVWALAHTWVAVTAPASHKAASRMRRWVAVPGNPMCSAQS